ncbi:histidine phosphatase family protein [Streptomyces sp. NPDC056144]|uniref:histidine phosphatase family protein n=1 Tax=unclassified Streptomyces TaxID=2593676 RepID=UPI0035DA9F03
MMLAIVRHAESIENATKNTGFYQDPRPWTGSAAHELSRDLVGLTPRGFRQACWLTEALRPFTGPAPQVFTSEYRRAVDTATIAFPTSQTLSVTGLLNEMHYGDVTYMGLPELFATYPEEEHDRRHRKHTWTPPGPGGESLAVGVYARAARFADIVRQAATLGTVVAVTHLTTIMALRAVFEQRPVEDLVTEFRAHKMANAAILRYEIHGARCHLVETIESKL